MLRKANEQSLLNFSSESSKVLAQTALPVCYTGDFTAFSSQTILNYGNVLDMLYFF